MGLCHGKTPGGDRPCWPDLPLEIAGLILSRLLSHDDRLSFAAACPEWRLAAQHHRTLLPPAMPCINLGDGSYQSIVDGKVRRFATPSQSHVDASFGSWLLGEPHGCSSRRCSLLNPFSPSTSAIEVPCWYQNRCVYRVITEPSSQPTRLAARCEVVNTCDPTCRQFSVQKIIILSPHLGVAMFEDGPFMAGPINFASFSPGSLRWSHPADTSTFRRHVLLDFIYKDMEFHRGKIFAVGGSGHLFSHELVAGETPSLGHGEHVIKERPNQSIWEDANYHLVTSSDKQKLLLVLWSIPELMNVIKIDRHSICLQVFEADLDRGQWLEVKDLGNQVLFVGTTGSKALAVTASSEHYNTKFRGGNRVFILGNDLAWAWRRREFAPCKCSDCRKLKNGIPSYCVYDMISKKTSLVTLSNGSSSVTHFRSEWFFPSV